MPKSATATRFTGTYPGRPEQVRDARRAVARHLAGCLRADDATLVVSELASNAILHSASRGEFFTVRVAPGGAGNTMTDRTAWTWWKRSQARTAGEPNPPVTAAGSPGHGLTWRRWSEAEHRRPPRGPAWNRTGERPKDHGTVSQCPFR
jgi:hypothetical protein